jgi:hypothetical protein
MAPKADVSVPHRSIQGQLVRPILAYEIGSVCCIGCIVMYDISVCVVVVAVHGCDKYLL